MTKTGNISLTVKPLRVSEWWESKFGPLFGTIYATSVLFQIPFRELLPFVVFLLIALLPGASFVSLINDLTDLREDKLAGKENRLEGKSKIYALSLILACITIGLIISFFLSKLAFLLYLSSWIVFTLYSQPPIRLKTRGIWGVLADTFGANVFPQLFAISILTDWYGKNIDIWWFCAVGSWSFFLGLRGILSHQLTDRDNDQKAGVRTFVQNYKSSAIRQVVRWLIFPLEITAFGLMIYYTHNIWALIFLGIYVVLTLLIHYLWEIRIALVCETKKDHLLLSDYYFIFYPLAFLLAGLPFFQYVWLAIIFHILLFSGSIYKFAAEICGLFYDMTLLVREFLLGY